MAIERLEFNSWEEAFAKMRGSVSARVPSLDGQHIVLVPENLTLHTEKLLFRGGGAFDVEVTDFNRLFSLFAETEGYLPGYGAVMLIKRIIRECRSQLKFYHKNAPYSGFAELMYDTVCGLVKARVAPSELKAEGFTGRKLEDISLIYTKYLDALGGRYIDAAGRSELLAEELKKRDLSKSEFYIAGFEDFTAQEKLILDILERGAKKVVYYKTAGEPEHFNLTEMYEAASSAAQLKAAAVRIRHFVKNGARYGDCCIISPTLGYAQAKRILTEFEIPFFIDKKITVGEQSLTRYLKLLVSITEDGARAADFIDLSKNYYSGADKTDADIFENYCLKYCIDYLRFYSPFTLGKKEELLAAERVRADLAKAATEFAHGFKAVQNAEDFCRLIESTLQNCRESTRTEELSALSGINYARVTGKIIENASLIGRIYEGAAASAAELSEVFFEGLNACRISFLPNENDAVSVGDAEVFKAGGYKHVFVIGFCDGEIPRADSDDSALSESDLGVLEEHGIKICPKLTERNKRNARVFLHAASAAGYLFLGYSRSGGKRPSPLAVYISERAKDCRHSSAESDSCELNAERDFARIARHCSTKSNTLEMLLCSLSRAKTDAAPYSFMSELEAVSGGGQARKFTQSTQSRTAFLSAGHNVFFRSNKTSVTKIQDYFLCPYASFLKNALNLREREDGKLSPLDIGNFLHGVFEEFFRAGDFCDPAKTAYSLAVRQVESDEKYRLERNRAVTERLIAEACALAPKLARQISAGQFVCRWQEKEFSDGKNDSLKSFEISAAGRKILLTGKIDRIDVYKDYARVIDYKTGFVKRGGLELNKLYYGTKIQLPIYMRVLEENGFKPAGLFYFPLSAEWNDDDLTHRFSGVFSSDPELLLAMDSNLSEPGYKSPVINCKRNLRAEKGSDAPGFSAYKNACTTEELSLICKYACKALQGAADEILQGYIEPSPFENACDFCTFTPVCKLSSDTARSRKPLRVDAPILISAAKEEEEV